MANSKYTQVSELLAAGKLNWRNDRILGLLRTDTAFDATHKTVADLDGVSIGEVPIQGRSIGSGGVCLGYPAFFSAVPGDTPFQLVLVQDMGTGDPNLIGFFDKDETNGNLIAQNDGTFVVRPGVPNPDNGYDPAARVWMVV